MRIENARIRDRVQRDARGVMREARGERREARSERREARGERRETRREARGVEVSRLSFYGAEISPRRKRMTGGTVFLGSRVYAIPADDGLGPLLRYTFATPRSDGQAHRESETQ